MAIKDILVHVGNSARQGCVDVAAALAAQHGAHVMGVHVTTPPDIPPYIEAQLGADVIDAQVRFGEEMAAEAKAAFDQGLGANNISTEWRTMRGDLIEGIQAYGRYADLVIVGQVNPDEPAMSSSEDVAGRLALSLGRPVLAVPYAGSFATVGKRVLVAWDGSRAAARAMGDAMALMRQADAVEVLGVNVEEGDSGGQDAVAHLSRHGIKAVARTVQARDMEPGAMMLSHAADFGADMLVMGAYGHARWRELVMGGVTQHMLEHMTIPVLMSH
ncbi:universal stress protein [Magnetovibrio sp.]|uniref:universal stress protein n=1 Tax=Magnetovibrio sp. TaxID=2024836 RepID=UPI002F9481C2